MSGAAAFPRPGAPAQGGSSPGLAATGPASRRPRRPRARPLPARRGRWRGDPPLVRCGGARSGRRDIVGQSDGPRCGVRRSRTWPRVVGGRPDTLDDGTRSQARQSRAATSIATASPRPGATAYSGPFRHGPRRATPAVASSRWTTRVYTSPPQLRSPGPVRRTAGRRGGGADDPLRDEDRPCPRYRRGARRAPLRLLRGPVGSITGYCPCRTGPAGGRRRGRRSS